MKIQQEFSKSAKYYDDYNIIQQEVAKKLVSLIPNKPKNILDIGCGSGTVYKKIDWELDSFIGVDFSTNMLQNHPLSKKIRLVNGDFNDEIFLKSISNYKVDCILSSSSLQWAKNPDMLFYHLSLLKVPMYLAIFTSNTFKTLNKIIKSDSIILGKEKIISSIQKYFNINYEVCNYNLKFDSKDEMFKYIKKSGVSGNRNILTFKQTKKLIQEYPLDYLEFEVLFINPT